MILIADIGNTRIKWALAESGQVVAPGHAAHAGLSGRAYAALATAFEQSPLAAPEPARSGDLAARLVAAPGRLVAACVRGAEFRAGFAARVRARWGIEVQWLASAEAGFGVRCGYRDWRRLGVDRWVALIAARQRVPGGVCIVDAGTTVTFDAMDADGQHLGGLIMPGPRLTARALAAGTADIGPTRQRLGRPEGLALLGRSTAEAVGHAALLAVAAGVDRAVSAVATAWGKTPPLLLTGGDGPVLAAWLESAHQYRADLVLEGLAYIVSQS